VRTSATTRGCGRLSVAVGNCSTGALVADVRVRNRYRVRGAAWTLRVRVRRLPARRKTRALLGLAQLLVDRLALDICVARMRAREPVCTRPIPPLLCRSKALPLLSVQAFVVLDHPFVDPYLPSPSLPPLGLVLVFVLGHIPLRHRGLPCHLKLTRMGRVPRRHRRT